MKAMHEWEKRQLEGTLKAMKVLGDDNHKIAALSLYRAITGGTIQAALAVYKIVVELQQEDSE